MPLIKDMAISQKHLELTTTALLRKGGPGSGDAGHAGRPGEVGGSGTAFPKILNPLMSEARKYSTPEEFEHAFLIEIKHGLYFHWTNDPNFKLSAEIGPRDMSTVSAGGSDPGALMFTSDLHAWADYGPGGRGRAYAAVLDLSNAAPNTYRQVSRGFGNEFYMSAEHTPDVRVASVLTRAQAFALDRRYQNAIDSIAGPADLARLWHVARSAPDSKNSGNWQILHKVAKANSFSYKSADAPTGVMVALFIPSNVATKLQLPNGLDPDSLHLTLAFLGKAAQLENPFDLMATVAKFAKTMPPLTGTITGVDRFTAKPGEPEPIFATVDIPELTKWRGNLVRMLNQGEDKPATDHDFHPHITLMYVPPGTPAPITELPPYVLNFDTLTLAIGGKRYQYPMAGALAETKGGPGSGGPHAGRPGQVGGSSAFGAFELPNEDNEMMGTTYLDKLQKFEAAHSEEMGTHQKTFSVLASFDAWKVSPADEAALYAASPESKHFVEWFQRGLDSRYDERAMIGAQRMPWLNVEITAPLGSAERTQQLRDKFDDRGMWGSPNAWAKEYPYGTRDGRPMLDAVGQIRSAGGGGVTKEMDSPEFLALTQPLREYNELALLREPRQIQDGFITLRRYASAEHLPVEGISDSTRSWSRAGIAPAWVHKETNALVSARVAINGVQASEDLGFPFDYHEGEFLIAKGTEIRDVTRLKLRTVEFKRSESGIPDVKRDVTDEARDDHGRWSPTGMAEAARQTGTLDAFKVIHNAALGYDESNSVADSLSGTRYADSLTPRMITTAHHQIYKASQQALRDAGYPAVMTVYRKGSIDGGVVSVSTKPLGTFDNSTVYKVNRSDILTFGEALQRGTFLEHEMHVDGSNLQSTKGGPGSGDHGHAGRPGQVGGSGSREWTTGDTFERPPGGEHVHQINGTELRIPVHRADVLKVLDSIPKDNMQAAMGIIRDLPFEVGLCYRPDGTEILRDSNGQPDRIEWSPVQIRAMRGGVMLHNHPSRDDPEGRFEDSSFSPPTGSEIADFGTAMLARLSELRLVTENFNFTLAPPPGQGFFPTPAAWVTRAIADAKQEFNASPLGVENLAGRVGYTEMQREAFHQMWIKFAEKTTFQYTRTPK